MKTLDVAAVRKDFPIFDSYERDAGNGKPLVYLDSANSSQKPRQVIDAMTQFMESSDAPINRSAYRLAAAATDTYEAARAAIARFVNAPSADEVVFTKNATEALNLVAKAWGGAHLQRGDVVVLTQMEHHANIVPWHQLAAERGIELRWIGLTSDGQLDLTNLHELLDGAKVLSFTAMSNVLGTITPAKLLCDAAHEHGALAVVDACQSVPHLSTDVQAIGADLCAFSSHKMLGPTGLGFLWGRAEVLDATPPFLGGGNMIADVRFDGFTPAPVPHKFEAGTPPIIEAAGVLAAVDYLTGLDMAAVRHHEMEITRYALDTLKARLDDRITLHGPDNVEVRGGTISFVLDGVHPHDVSQVLDEDNVCVRAGHHCAKPLMRVLGVPATARASFYVYNDESDVDALADGLVRAADFFGF
jgi:cysteine desulfurase / selenocysteine lyase